MQVTTSHFWLLYNSKKVFLPGLSHSRVRKSQYHFMLLIEYTQAAYLTVAVHVAVLSIKQSAMLGGKNLSMKHFHSMDMFYCYPKQPQLQQIDLLDNFPFTCKLCLVSHNYNKIGSRVHQIACMVLLNELNSKMVKTSS